MIAASSVAARPLLRALLLSALVLAPACTRTERPAATETAQAEQSAAIPFTRAEVTSADGRQFALSWQAAGASLVTVFASTAPDGLAEARPVGSGGGTDTLAVSGLPEAARWYFRLVPDRGAPLVVAERGLHLASVPNFRDVGGFRAADGRWVRMGRLYRSDQLDHLSDADLARLRAIGLRLVCDLRTEPERAAGPDRVPEGAAHLVADVLKDQTLPSGRGAMDPAAVGNWLADGERTFAALYRQFVSAPAAREAYRALFTRLAAPGGQPGLFHCTAGKDRTGWAAAALLSLLGVPEDQIVADYMASNRYLEQKNRATMERMRGQLDDATVTKMQAVMVNRESYIAAAFDEVRQRHGSIEAYFTDGLDLPPETVAALRRSLLTD